MHAATWIITNNLLLIIFLARTLRVLSCILYPDFGTIFLKFKNSRRFSRTLKDLKFMILWWETWDPTIQTNPLSFWQRANLIHLILPSALSPIIRELFCFCCRHYGCVTNHPNFMVSNTDHFIMLIESMGQASGQNTWGGFILCSSMSRHGLGR